MNSKKAITLLVLVTLIMGLVPTFVFADITLASALTHSGADHAGKGTVVVVLGSGVTGGKTVNLYWDYVQAWNGEAGLINSTKAKASGSYNVTFKVPEGINGAHYLWVEDAQTLSVASIEFDVDATLKLSSTSGLVGDRITINGYGFTDDNDINIYFDNTTSTRISTSSTNDLGSFARDVTVPSALDGAHSFIAMDEENITATKTFTIGPVITIDKDEGPTGTVVAISGRGFTNGSTIDSITVGGIPAFNTSSGKLTVSASTGKFKYYIVIPYKSGSTTLSADNDYDIIVHDADGDSATVSFTVTGEPDITLTPQFGGVQELISITGENFTQIKDKEVDIYLVARGALIGSLKPAGTLKTTASGTFSGTFRVPAAANGEYLINAGVPDMYINATAGFRVGLMVVILTPTSGPQGDRVSISGVGFSNTTMASGDDWNASINGMFLAQDKADDSGVVSGNFYVPNIEPGTYPIEVYDIDADITVTLDFTVTDVTNIVLDPPQAANGYNITIDGFFFSQDQEDNSSYSVSYILYNDTDEWDITGDLFNRTTYDNGNVTAVWTVYDNETLSLGSYLLNVTDSNEIYAQIPFDVVEPVVNVSPKRDTYNVDDTVAFNVNTTFKEDGSYFKIYDPAGNLYWKTDALNTWIKVGYYQVVPFYAQTSGGNPMILVPDAPLGTWTWKMYKTNGDLIESGTFTVEASTSAQLQGQIEDLNTAVNNLQTEVGTVSDSIASVKSDVQSAITAANAAVNAANAATQAVNQVSSVASDAAKAAQDAATAAQNAQNAANGLTTLVYGAIGASLVAAIAAIVSLMQISRRIAG